MRKVVAAKLHGLHVTGADIDYHGSITLDPDHCDEAGILPLEFVEIWNNTSGARISTYVIFGERGSRCCILNGAAARTCQKGDQIIICSAHYISSAEIPAYQPKILTFDRDNKVVGRLGFRVAADAGGGYKFSILVKDETSQSASIARIDFSRPDERPDHSLRPSKRQ